MRESIIQNQIMTYLQILENQGKLVFVRNNSAAVKLESGRYMKTGKKGSSDIIIGINGIALFMEVKSAKGKQTKSQVVFEDKVKKAGCIYCVVHSLEEAMHNIEMFISPGM